jgi:hypothetical protein
MTSVPRVEQTAVQPRAVRLSLKPIEPISGYVDGGWWPHSRDLAVEAAELIAALPSRRLGAIRQVSYSVDAWEPAPPCIKIGVGVEGRWVMLAAFDSQDPLVLQLTDASGWSLSLLVVPPETTAGPGYDAMRRAAGPGDIETPAVLLAASGVRPEPALDGPRRPQNFSARGAEPR